MKVIVTHTNSDFDAIGALIAASKLHPDALPILGYNLKRRVKEFIRLHRYHFKLSSPKSIIWENVKEVIMVDFHNIDRGEGLEKIPDINKVKWTIYDHHPKQDIKIKPVYEEIRLTGSTVGILVKHLKKKENIELSFLEATLMSLGVYTDTGRLTFPNTTVDDALAVAWLLEKKADLNIISEYTKGSLEDEQMELLDDILENIEIIEVESNKILFCHHNIEQYIADLSVISKKISDLYAVDVIFISVTMGKRTYLIGQSRNKQFNVLEIMAEFSPKGHYQAGFAKIKKIPSQTVIEKIKSEVQSYQPEQILAKDIMTSPVRTIEKDMTIDLAKRLMFRYGHSGLIVVEGTKIVGIVSRRDIEKAVHHKINTDPVKNIMSQKVQTISPETTFNDIENLIVKKDMGRFPVVESGLLKGIVTRTDILKTIYNKEVKKKKEKLNFSRNDINLDEKMQEYFSEEHYQFLRTVGEIADEMNYKIYIVGGGVRDLVLGHGKDVDIDIAVEGNGIKFAEKVSEHYSAQLIVHKKYGTAKVKLPNDTIDIATARTEFYQYPAASPDVDFSSIKHDLYRRDFTINALAVHLNSNLFGQLLDYFDGYKHLKTKKLKILHNLSFIEDPNRIFRAIRFEIKLGFKLDKETEKLALNAMNTGKFTGFINDRIKTEIKKLFTNSYQPVKNIKRLIELRAVRCLSPKFEAKESFYKKLGNLFLNIEIFKTKYKVEIKEWILYLLLIIYYSDKKLQKKTIDKLNLQNNELELVNQILELKTFLSDYQWQDLSNSDIYFFWKKYSIETAIFALSIDNNSNLHYSIYKFWQELKDTKLEISGLDLKKLGIQGKQIGETLEIILLAKLNNKVNNKAEELELVNNIINGKK